MTFSQFQSQFHLSLNSQQEAAVQAAEGPVLLLAVPGSGKTTVLVARLGYMIHVLGIPPEEILTVTYTVSATHDMRRRFAALFGDELAERMEFRTINGMSSQIIRHYERALGRRAFALLDAPGEQAAILGEIYRKLNGEFASESAIKTIQTAITYVKNGMLSGEEISALNPDGLNFAPIYQEYCRVLRERELMDYDDQMVYAHQILRRHPDILRAFQRRCRYLCVDEAQDTSRIQHAILRLLAQGSGNIFMVGDEDQSIYGFRAACPQALMEFEQTYPGARVLFLEQNYRSTPQIVRAADSFIRQNQNRRPKQMAAVRPGGAEVAQIPVRDRKGQYRCLLRLAQNCKEETAVLYRDNDSALPLIDLLDREGVPYRCRQVDSTFFSHRIVRDIADIIRFARNPGSGELFLNIYYKLGAGITKAAAEEAAQQSPYLQQSILEYLSQLSALSPWSRKQCRALQTHLSALLEEPADRAVYRIVHFMGYGDFLEQRDADPGKVQILEALGARESTPEGLLDRLDQLRQVVRAGSSSPGCPFILSTIHSSKGLEYDRVILMDVADGLLPKSVPGEGAPEEERAAYEEERRLFYVAMTRAKNQLSLFRFQSPDLPSTFARALFPEPSPAPRRRSAPAPLRPAPRGPDVLSLAPRYTAGTRVVHKSFGPGVLTAKNGDIVTLELDGGGSKRLSLSAALRSGQLSLEGA